MPRIAQSEHSLFVSFVFLLILLHLLHFCCSLSLHLSLSLSNCAIPLLILPLLPPLPLLLSSPLLTVIPRSLSLSLSLSPTVNLTSSTSLLLLLLLLASPSLPIFLCLFVSFPSWPNSKPKHSPSNGPSFISSPDWRPCRVLRALSLPPGGVLRETTATTTPYYYYYYHYC